MDGFELVVYKAGIKEGKRLEREKWETSKPVEFYKSKYEAAKAKNEKCTRLERERIREWVEENYDVAKVPEFGDIEPVAYITKDALLEHLKDS